MQNMSERLVGTFWGYQDAELYYQTWQPSTSVGTIIITHGLAEHSDCYHDLATDFGENKWRTFAWDLRGHGRSEGKRGYVNRFQDFCDDLEAFIRFVKSQKGVADHPLVLFGHSLGGLITLKTLLNHSPSQISALALSSPALGLTVEVPKIKEKAAHFLSDWLPKMTMHNEIDFRQLTRDEKLVRSYKNDPFRHDKISPRLFLGMEAAMAEVLTGASEIHLPTIMQLAGRDRIVSTPSSEKFFDKLGSKRKEIFIYTESYHEIFNDLDRKEVIDDLLKFLNKKTGTPG